MTSRPAQSFWRRRSPPATHRASGSRAPRSLACSLGPTRSARPDCGCWGRGRGRSGRAVTLSCSVTSSHAAARVLSSPRSGGLRLPGDTAYPRLPRPRRRPLPSRAGDASRAPSTPGLDPHGPGLAHRLVEAEVVAQDGPGRAEMRTSLARRHRRSGEESRRVRCGAAKPVHEQRRTDGGCARKRCVDARAA